ncbi:MAG: hypothetical protein KDC54_18230, partial [Lewinella sp.]|nr:hypothetical protein [Lewinella sp.]
MRRWMMWWCVLLILAGISPLRAQQLEQFPEQGYQTVTFDVAQGQKTVYLPANLHRGDVLSGVVVDEPKGRNDRQRQRNSGTLEGYVVEVEQGTNEPGPGFLKTTLPGAMTGTVVNLLLRDKQGRVVDRIPLPVEPAVPTPPIELTPEPGDMTFPGVMQAGQPTLIDGPFDGDLATTDLIIDDLPGVILVESPDGIVVQAPDDVSGPVVINLTEQDVPYTTEVNVVDIKLTADNLRLHPGQRAQVALTLTGLPNDGPPILVDVVNLTPGIAAMSGGNQWSITIDPARAGEVYTQNFTLTGLEAGAFTVQATVHQRRTPTLRLVYPTNGMIVETEEASS